MIDAEKFYRIAVKQLGKQYGFGQKWDLNDPDPKTPIDCSGFVRWLIHQSSGICVPDGSQEQFRESILLNPQSLAGPTDIGFFKREMEGIHHVGIILDGEHVIEARGLQSDSQGHPLYNKVILRPRSIWESWHEFTGWMRFKELMDDDREVSG